MPSVRATPADNTVVNAPIEKFWRAIRLDLFGTFLGCRFGIPAIIASGGGSVINMASNVPLMAVAGLDCYTAAKGWHRSDYAVDGGGIRAEVRVNVPLFIDDWTIP
jgi:NAD(P)-dependent dehydrogenase (short-subunit alcohol dehydrogenase family)